MKILVCVKQVPHIEGVAVKQDNNKMATLEAFGPPRINRFDEFAVEQAVRFKETLTGVHVDVITVGPEPAAQVLKRALGMGADSGIHLLTSTDADPGPEAVSAWIAQFAGPRGYELILCGSMSEDCMTGQVGPMTAALLNLPYATQVMEIQPDRNLAGVSVEREIEGGAREMVFIRLPALLALQPGINRPRYPSLSNLLRANKQGLEIIPTQTLAQGKVNIRRSGFVLPAHERASQLITGSAVEKAAQTAEIMKAKGLI
jgi:electron transfer flavoprotein beta subunit